jgi:hypothetical protein
MLYVEEQENYKDSPLVATSDFKYANPNPLDVISGLFGKGKEVYESGKGVVESMSGQGTATTNIGGYDVTYQGNQPQNTQTSGVAKPLLIVGGVAVVLIVGYVVYSQYKNKKA